MAYLVDEILPTSSVHILGSTAGALVRPFLTHFLTQFSRGEPILGHPSRPAPFLYLSADPPSSLFDGLKVKSPCSPLKWAKFGVFEPIVRDLAPSGLAPWLKDGARAGVKLVVADNLTPLAVEKNLISLDKVHLTMEGLRAAAQELDIALLLALPSAKGGSRYSQDSPFSRWYGSVGFLEASTRLTLEPWQAKLPDAGLQKLWVSPRGSKTEYFCLDFDREKDTFEVGKPPTSDAPLEEFFRKLVPPARFTRSQLREIAVRHDFSMKTADRWVRGLVKEGRAEKLADALWAKRLPS